MVGLQLTEQREVYEPRNAPLVGALPANRPDKPGATQLRSYTATLTE